MLVAASTTSGFAASTTTSTTSVGAATTGVCLAPTLLPIAVVATLALGL
jgi:hypothetical protein